MMVDWFVEAHPVLQAFLATCFTWGLTAAGAAPVFLVRKMNQTVLDGMLGLASGVMIAASYWSLLAPAIEMSDGVVYKALIGFLAGGAFLFAIDKLLPHVHPGHKVSEAEGVKTSWKRSTLLILAITLHNFPEGLAVGVAFGAAANGLNGAALGGAIALAIGIGIQNFPEGTAVAMPLRREGFSRRRSFMYGQFSGVVEPIGGVIGAAAVLLMKPLLPYALAFAAGAMIYVVAEELIPASKKEKESDVPTIGVMVGFAIMMSLDVILG